MGTLKDAYDILKDLLNEAKKLQNEEMISLSIEIQEKLFEFKEEFEQIKDENKELKEQLESYKKPSIKEEDIEYSKNGFFTLKTDNRRIPYCSACWKTEKRLVPLSRYSRPWDYRCSRCQAKIIVFYIFVAFHQIKN